MQAGDFEEAKLDFEAVGLNNTLSFSCQFWRYHLFSITKFNDDVLQMIKVDKSAEPDATAALAKLKLKEQVRSISSFLFNEHFNGQFVFI